MDPPGWIPPEMHPTSYDSDDDAVVVPLRTAVDPPVAARKAARKDPPVRGSDDDDFRNELAESDNPENEQISKPLTMVALSVVSPMLAVLGSVSDDENGHLTTQWTQCDPPPCTHDSDNNEKEHKKSSLVSPLPWLLRPRQPPCSSANSAAAESPSGRVANSQSILAYVSHSKYISDEDDDDTRDDACLPPHYDHGAKQDAADHDQSELDTGGTGDANRQSMDPLEHRDHATTTIANLSNSTAEPFRVVPPDAHSALGRGKIPASDNDTMDDSPGLATTRAVVNLASHLEVLNEHMAVTPVSTSMVALASREPSLVIPQYANTTTPLMEPEAEARLMPTTPSWMPKPFRSTGPTQNILAGRAAWKWWSKRTKPSLSFDEPGLPVPYSSSSTVVATGVPGMAKVGAVRRQRHARDGGLGDAPTAPSLSVETITPTATATTTIRPILDAMAVKCDRTSQTKKQWMRRIAARSTIAR
jgi:hypothetical protein